MILLKRVFIRKRGVHLIHAHVCWQMHNEDENQKQNSFIIVINLTILPQSPRSTYRNEIMRTTKIVVCEVYRSEGDLTLAIFGHKIISHIHILIFLPYPYLLLENGILKSSNKELLRVNIFARFTKSTIRRRNTDSYCDYDAK